MVQETVVDWNNGVNQFPMLASEQVIDGVKTALQPVTQAHRQCLVNVHISTALHCTYSTHQHVNVIHDSQSHPFSSQSTAGTHLGAYLLQTAGEQTVNSW